MSSTPTATSPGCSDRLFTPVSAIATSTKRLRRFLSLVLVLSSALWACADPSPDAAGADTGSAAPPVTAAAVSMLDPPAGFGSLAPRLASGREGTMLTWLEPVDTEQRKAFRLMTAELKGGSWGAPGQVARGEEFFANWADVPASVESSGGVRFAHWLQKLGNDTYAYGVQLARSDDGGASWQGLGLLHDDDSPSEHGFVSYAALEDGVQAFWLDGREKTAEDPETFMQLRTTRLDEEGAPPPSTVLDDSVCECCQTDAALTNAGPIVVYRNRDAAEVRDIAVVRSTDEGWTEPAILHPDGWRIFGCPVNGPAVAADGDAVAVAWFTAGQETPRVLMAFSGDAGASFGPPIEIDVDQPLGQVDVALGDGRQAYVSWVATVGEAAEIRLRRVAPDGERGEAQRVAVTTAKRSAGVPRMIHQGDDLVLAWVEDTESPRIRVGLVPLADLGGSSTGSFERGAIN